MLRQDVVEARRRRSFMSGLLQNRAGVELLTGTSGGVQEGSGAFDSGTAFARVNQRLFRMAKMLKEFE